MVLLLAKKCSPYHTEIHGGIPKIDNYNKYWINVY